MQRRALWLLLGLGLVVAQPVMAQLGRIELLTGLELGLLHAEFRGNGDSSVYGRILAVPGGPTQVTIDPGTQFWPLANAGLGGLGQGAFGQIGSSRGGLGQGSSGQGGFGQGGGGRQGMGTLGLLNLDLGQDRYAQVTLPTVCTNLAFLPPTRRDIMVPARCPDQRVASIAALYGQLGVQPAAIQLAVWAIANDPPSSIVTPYLGRAVRAEKKARPESSVTPGSLLAAAAALLHRVGATPREFKLFRSPTAADHLSPSTD